AQSGLPYGEEIVEYGGEVIDPSCGDFYYGAPCGYTRIWGRAEYLVWWTKSMNVPPLATTSDTGTVQDNAGVLGLTTTDILFGNGSLNDEARSGARFTLGTWFDDTDMCGLEVNYMFLGEESNGFAGSD